jgi:unsaturated chondroitin disaccharide hydrolase
MKGHFYWSTAILILRTLCTKYLANSDPKWGGILKGGVYHLHKGLGVDESVMWGEYFFIEALEQALRVMRTGAPRIVNAPAIMVN